MKKDKKTFDQDKEELGFGSKQSIIKKKKEEKIILGQLTESQKNELAAEEFALKNEVGLIEDNSLIEVKRIKKKLIGMQTKLPEYKATFDRLTIDKMR